MVIKAAAGRPIVMNLLCIHRHFFWRNSGVIARPRANGCWYDLRLLPCVKVFVGMTVEILCLICMVTGNVYSLTNIYVEYIFVQYFK